MYELLKRCFNICLLKQGPQDIPGTPHLLKLLIPIYFFVSFLMLMLSSEIIDAALQVMVEVVLILSLPYIILMIAKKPERYQQTTSALVATDTLISLFALPAMATLIGQGTAFALLTIVALMIWHWVVSGHIFSQALEQPFFFGLGVAFLYIVISYQVMGMLFPEIIIAE